MAPQIPWGLIFVAAIASFFLYRFCQYYWTEECQECRLFKSEYEIHIDERNGKIEERKSIRDQILGLQDGLSDEILDRELRNTSISRIDDIFGIGEKTVSRLYDSGFETLKDLDSIRFRRSTMPDYVGSFKYDMIKSWYTQEKKSRKERIIDEIKAGLYSGTQIGKKIEILKEDFRMCSEEIERQSRIISSFNEDLQRYREVSFINFLKNNMEIPIEEILNLELKETGSLLHRIPVRVTKEELEQLREEFHEIERAHPESYNLELMADEETGRRHFFVIHSDGISFFYEDAMRIVYFGKIKCCSKIGNKLLLKLEKEGKIRINLLNDAELIYKSIKILRSSFTP